MIVRRLAGADLPRVVQPGLLVDAVRIDDERVHPATGRTVRGSGSLQTCRLWWRSVDMMPSTAWRQQPPGLMLSRRVVVVKSVTLLRKTLLRTVECRRCPDAWQRS